MRTFLTSLLLILYLPLAAQSNLILQPTNIPNLPGLQSFAHASYNGEWYIIGGRTDGLHRRQPWASFDNAGHNEQIFIVDPQNQSFKSISLQGLNTALFDQLRSTNMEFYQEDSLLYLIGGYGYSTGAGDHITHPNLVVVNLSQLSTLNNNDMAPASAFQTVFHNDFAVTGGHLKKMGSSFYLVGGHRFDGRYNPMNGPSFTQTYTNAVRRFQLNWQNGNPQITWHSPINDAVNLHRRDYNVLSEIRTNGDYGLIAYSGVFQVGVDLPYLSAVQIDSSGASEIAGFSQYYNHYHCANVALYDAQANEMHNFFFGGMAQYFDQNGVLTQDNNVPFVKTIAQVTRDSLGVYREFKMNTEMPALLGAGSEFFPNPSLIEYAHGILDLNSMTNDTVLLGHIYGGIESTAPNIFFINTGVESSASNSIFAVYMVRNQGQIGGLFNEASVQNISWQIAPNPSHNKFRIWYQQAAGNGEYQMKIYDERGGLLKTEGWQAPNEKGSFYQEFVLDRFNSGVYFLELWFQGQAISSQRLIMR